MSRFRSSVPAAARVVRRASQAVADAFPPPIPVAVSRTAARMLLAGANAPLVMIAKRVTTPHSCLRIAWPFLGVSAFTGGPKAMECHLRDKAKTVPVTLEGIH